MNEKTLIVIPTYDERENVAAMARAVLAEVPAAHILFVDDNSPDGTGQVLDEIAVHLGTNDLTSLSDHLRIDLPQLLDRFQDLLPILKDYINDEYLAPSN